MAHGVASRYDSFIELDALQNQIDSAINRSNHLLREMGADPNETERRGRRSKRTVVSSTPAENESSGRRLSSAGVERRRSVSEGRRDNGSVFTRTLETESGVNETPQTQNSRRSDRQEQSIREAVENYLGTMTRNVSEKYKVPPIVLPKFEVGGDWRCFLTEFREMAELADLKPTHQMVYFKQAIPEEAKKMLFQHKVGTIQQAVELLSELYDPVKDTWTVLQELEKITQKPGERLRVLASRIEEVARRYEETLANTSPADLNKLIVSRFKHAIADEETRNHLLWDLSESSLDKMVQKAQQFEDARQTFRGRKNRRMVGEENDSEQLRKENFELKQKLERLQKKKTTAKKYSVLCWNCGEKGHFSRNCSQEKKGDGFTFRPKKGEKESSERQNTESQNLNSKVQGEKGRSTWRK